WPGGPDADENRQSLCKSCHEVKTRAEMGYQTIGADGWPVHAVAANVRRPLSPQAEARRFPQDLRPSRIPLTIVCGPPGSGKSTYVQQHATARDVVIDLDAILSRLSGLPMHAVMTRWLGAALEDRNSRLRALATDTTHAHAWFVIAAPDPLERERWSRMLGAELVLLDVDAEECKRRISADPSRRGHAPRMHVAVDLWWTRNDGTNDAARMDDGCTSALTTGAASPGVGGWA